MVWRYEGDEDGRMPAFYRYRTAFHEAGHAAIIYWYGGPSSLLGRWIELYDGGGGTLGPPDCAFGEKGLMRCLGGPMAEALSVGVIPDKAIRGTGVFRDPHSDAYQIRQRVCEICGKYDRKYQIEVQGRVRAVLQDPRIWQAIKAVAERLIADGKITGEEMDSIFKNCRAPRLYGDGDMKWQGPAPTPEPIPPRSPAEIEREARLRARLEAKRAAAKRKD
jgi:hypothetical protein